MRPTGEAIDGRPIRDSFLVFGEPLIGRPRSPRSSTRCARAGSGRDRRSSASSACSRSTSASRTSAASSSCTAALILGMKALGLGPGDEVIVPAMTFVASANAVEHAGATPVLVDCEPGTGLIDLDAAEARDHRADEGDHARSISPAARSTWTASTRCATSTGSLVIEDAAHALGAEWRGRRIGSLGNLTAYSFYVTKNITTIEGGALASADDAVVASEVERLAFTGSASAPGSATRSRLQALRGRGAGLQVQHDRPPGRARACTSCRSLDEWIDRRAELVGPLRRAAGRPARSDRRPTPRTARATPAPVPGARRPDARAGRGEVLSTTHRAAGSAPACTTAACTCTRTTASSYGISRRGLAGGHRHLRADAQPAAQPEGDRGRPGRRRRGDAFRLGLASPDEVADRLGDPVDHRVRQARVAADP